MNLTDLKDRISSSFSTLSLACISIISDNQLLSGMTGYSAIILGFFTAYGEYKVKQANIRKIDAEIKELSNKE